MMKNRYPFAPKRPLVCCTAAAALGLAAGTQMQWHPLPVLAAVLLSAALAFLMRRRGKPAVYGVIPVFFFACVLASSLLMSVPFAAAGDYTVSGYVDGEPQIRENGSVRVVLRDARGKDESGRETYFGKTYWTFRPREDEELISLAGSMYDGDHVRFAASAYAPSGQVNPYGFDFRLYLMQSGFRAAVSGCRDPVLRKEASLTLSGRIFRLRTRMLDGMDAIFGEDAAWPQALLLGVRDRLQEDTVQAFRDLGIAHILAVSGLHVGLLAGFVQLVLHRLRLSRRARLIVLLGFLLLYAALLQFSASVVRASVLIFLSECRFLVRRSPDPLTTLSAAMLVILAFSPLQVMAAGFQLSFSAVLGIILLREPAARVLRFIRWRGVRDALAVTAGASLGVLIPTAGLYHSVSLAGFIVSPAVCFLMALLLPVLLVITAVGAVWLPAGQALAHVLHVLTGWMIPAARQMGGLPGVRLSVPALPLISACALIAVLLLCTRYCLIPVPKRAAIGCVLLAAAVLIPLAQRDGRVSYIQFAEGQSDAAVIEDGDTTVLIDTGENGSDLAAYLLSVGRRADIVVLTHLHSDHCGGLLDLIADRVPIGRVILAPRAEEQAVDETGRAVMEAIREEEIPVETMARGDVFSTRRACFEVLWPDGARVRSGQDPNIYSMALLCTVESVRVLFTGDLTGDYEKYVLADADILKVAHHGSASSSTDAFLEAVTPELAVVTCRSDQYLPSAAAMERLRRSGSTVLRTDETGAVRLRFADGGYEITPFLNTVEWKEGGI